MSGLPGVALDRFVVPDREVIKLRNGQQWTLLNHIVDNDSAMLAMVNAVSQHTEAAYDTETSGLHPHLGARICGHAIAVQTATCELTNYYVPVRHQQTDLPQLPPSVVAGFFCDYFSRLGVTVRGHHLKFDALLARADGIALAGPWIDTALEAVIFDENEPRFGLKPLSGKHLYSGAADEETALQEWLHRDARILKMAYAKRKKVAVGEISEPAYLERYGYARSPIPLCGLYACHDVALTWLLHEFYATRIYPTYNEVYTREARTARHLLEMEWRGLPVNTAEIHRADSAVELEVAHWRNEIRVAVGYDPGTTDAELRALFYTRLGMEIPKYTAGGERSAPQASVDKEARSLLQKRYPAHAPLIKAVSKLAVAEKIRSTYAGTWLRYVSPQGRVHSAYNQLEQRDEEGVPKTGRLSSSDPNAQNVASQAVHLFDCCCVECAEATGRAVGASNTVSIRRYYAVPQGFVRVFIDLSQIEIRVLAWLSQDPRLLYCYANDLDVHQITADEVTNGNRKLGKIVNLGTQYGMSKIGLSKRLPIYTDDPEQAERDAEVFLDRYDATYAGVPRYRAALVQEMRANRGMFVNPFGRPRRIPAIVRGSRGEVNRATRMAMASMVSGSAADMNKEIMIRTCATLEKHYAGKNVAGYLVQTIHDENVYDLPIDGCGPVIHALHADFVRWPLLERDGMPVRANVAVSSTTWEGKRDLELLPDGVGFRLK